MAYSHGSKRVLISYSLPNSFLAGTPGFAFGYARTGGGRRERGGNWCKYEIEEPAKAARIYDHY